MDFYYSFFETGHRFKTFIVPDPRSRTFKDIKLPDNCDTITSPLEKMRIATTVLKDFSLKFSDKPFASHGYLDHPYQIMRPLDADDNYDSLSELRSIKLPIIIYGKDRLKAIIFVAMDFYYSSKSDEHYKGNRYVFCLFGERKDRNSEFHLYPFEYERWGIAYTYIGDNRIEDGISSYLFEEYDGYSMVDPKFFDESPMFKPRSDGTYDYQWIMPREGPEVFLDSIGNPDSVAIPPDIKIIY